jgi:hypothetical protein
MIRLQLNQMNTVQDAHAMLQTAIGVEFGTLPPESPSRTSDQDCGSAGDDSHVPGIQHAECVGRQSGSDSPDLSRSTAR